MLVTITQLTGDFSNGITPNVLPEKKGKGGDACCTGSSI